jgi:drug/metabolite transporter (DMT)-like permease
VSYFLAIVAAALLGAGFVLQQQVAERAPKGHFLHFRLLMDLVRDRRWLVGLLIMVLGQLLSAWVIGHLVLSAAEPLLAANLLFALLLAWPLSGQRLTKSEVAGAVTLIAGVAALSLARDVRSTEIAVGSPANWPFAAIAVGVASYGFAVLGRRRSGELRATLTGASAGLVFGLQDALTRRTVQELDAHQIAGLVTSWSGYALLVAGVIGLWLMESAFNAAPLYASLPAITAGEPVAGIAIGIAVFGDTMHTSAGLIAVQAAGLVALITGVILVARGPALTAVRSSHRPRAHPGQPGTVQPGTVQPGAIEPGAVEPGAIEPGTVQDGRE